ncbi:hypothetical protein PILCRDRAFT_830444 [Piloderma croceum F 1598]|uniref:Uncharacterized protein n=1 Tax=Piloderma croceum (strain F 1598) TaxID=765440 RepID=A0A0C3ETZ5_PILCF|nr:hypothetical protein PILCRDRAFT_830444 [Piloderma croceum F 1598]
MKAIKGLTIHKKLASYRSAFPHNDRTDVRNVTEIYNDVLEFSRPGLYSESVTRAAWELLLTRIGSGTTSQLIQALGRRPLVEVVAFLTTLTTSCMSDAERL